MITNNFINNKLDKEEELNIKLDIIYDELGKIEERLNLIISDISKIKNKRPRSEIRYAGLTEGKQLSNIK